MNRSSFALLIATGCFIAIAVMALPDHLHLQFQKFERKYSKVYSSADERTRRINIFAKNLARIEQVNAEGRSYTLGINQFTDWTWDEFKAKRLMAPQYCSATVGNHVMSGRLNESDDVVLDWRTKGVVTPVKDQGDCGSCWTFSTSGAVESAHAIKHGASSLVGLSEQQLVDCAGNFGNAGCDGGLPSQAFIYLMSVQGMDTEDSYPYEGTDDTCRFDATNIGATVVHEVNITQNDENAIADAVQNLGPVSIAFDVEDDFMSYSGGIYQSTECHSDPQSVNHAVLVVGFATDDTGTPYWIIKNSWSQSWGLDGYFWMLKGENMCGIATCAAYPIVG